MAEEYKAIKGFATEEGEARYDYEFLLNKPDIIGQIQTELEEYVPPVDDTLAKAGAAAEAAATGIAIGNAKDGAIQEAKSYTDQKKIEAIEEAEWRTWELLGEYIPDLGDVVYSGDDDNIPTIEQETIDATHLGGRLAEDFAVKDDIDDLEKILLDEFNKYYTKEEIGKSYLTAGQVKQDYLTIEGAKDIYATPEAVNSIVDERIVELSGGEIVLKGLATTEQLNEVKNSKAPAGYGLGSNAVTLVNSWADAKYNGFYRDIYGDLVDSPFPGIYAFGQVISYSQNDYIQIAYTTKNKHIIEKRRTYFGDADYMGEWEWVNPPMELGEEYRTTERWNGKVVYAKALNCGALAEYKNIGLDIGGGSTIIRGVAIMEGRGPLPFNFGDGNEYNCNAVFDVSMYLYSNGGYDGKTIYAHLWYVKDQKEV